MHPPLTIKQRSCLLRAARVRLMQLHEDYDALQGALDVTGRTDLIFEEIGCLTGSIKWLWLQNAT